MGSLSIVVPPKWLHQVFLKDGDAAVFNLSLLTSDFFAVVAAKYLFNEELSWLYFVGFSMIIAGLLIYNRSDAPTSDLDDKLEAQQGTTIQLLASADHA
jgi:solute carrier family 35 protein F1/2